MATVYKTLLLGVLATVVLAAIVSAIVYGIGVDPDLGAALIVLGAAGTGLIGGEVSRRMPPPRRRH